MTGAMETLIGFFGRRAQLCRFACVFLGTAAHAARGDGEAVIKAAREEIACWRLYPCIVDASRLRTHVPIPRTDQSRTLDR